MKKTKSFDKFIKKLEEAIGNIQNESDVKDKSIFVDVSINIFPNMGFAPIDLFVQKEVKIPIDILETEKSVHALIGLSGMDKESIKLSCSGQILEITACNAEGTINEIIELPARVNKRGMKTTYRNGVLEVVFNKSKKQVKNSNA